MPKPHDCSKHLIQHVVSYRCGIDEYDVVCKVCGKKEPKDIYDQQTKKWIEGGPDEEV